MEVAKPNSKGPRPFWFLVAILGAMTVLAGVSSFRTAKEIVPWRTDFQSALTEAATRHKPVLAYFTAGYCQPCQNLKHTTWADVEVEKALRGYVPVEIDIEKNPELAAIYAPEVVPTIVVLDANRAVVKSESGAMQPDDFLAWLKG